MKRTQIITMTLCLGLSSAALSNKIAGQRSKTSSAKPAARIANPVRVKAANSMRLKTVPGKISNSKSFSAKSTGINNSKTLSASGTHTTAAALKFYNSSVNPTYSVPTSDVTSLEIMDSLYIAFDDAEYKFVNSPADLELVANYRNEVEKEEWTTSLAPLLKFSGLFHGALELALQENEDKIESGVSVLRPSLEEYAAQKGMLPQINACAL